MKRAEVSGIRVELPTTSPVLLLRIEGGVTHVPIWIGSPEASMIALFAEGVDSPRPLTHDLVLDVAGAAGRSLERVEITALRDDVYEASLVFDDGGRVDSRASDAVALAMRASVASSSRTPSWTKWAFRSPTSRRKRSRSSANSLTTSAQRTSKNPKSEVLVDPRMIRQN